MPKPNILLITTDQQRYDTLGKYAPDFLRTPHIDHLARDGVSFDCMYSDCPICVPVRISIMSGKFAGNHGMILNGESSKVLGREGTLPSLFRACGYQTAAIGKMHFGPQRTRHGFDEMILPEDYYREMRFSGDLLQPMRHGMGQNEVYPVMSTVPESLTQTSWTAGKCMEYIRERRDPSLPFFLWCSFAKPHPPLDPPEPYYSMYRDMPVPAPAVGDWAKNENCPAAFKRMREAFSADLVPENIYIAARAAYYGLITQIDYNIGRIFAALNDMGIFDETMIMFTSDHGEYLGDHRTISKMFFHESSAHVPLLVRFPGGVDRRHAGERCRHMVTHVDILPTLLSAAGSGTPPDCDGEDIRALLDGNLENPRKYLEASVSSRALYMNEDFPAYFGISDGKWKYIWYTEGATEQLFDLEEDPLELNDLSGESGFELKKLELHEELVRREKQRDGEWLDGDKLYSRPIMNDSSSERRTLLWQGFHTEFTDSDVRH